MSIVDRRHKREQIKNLNKQVASIYKERKQMSQTMLPGGGDGPCEQTGQNSPRLVQTITIHCYVDPMTGQWIPKTEVKKAEGVKESPAWANVDWLLMAARKLIVPLKEGTKAAAMVEQDREKSKVWTPQ